MALAEKKQMEILNKVREIEGILTSKYKASKEGTFGSKIKEIQDNIENQFFVSSIWALVQIRNSMIHPGEYEIGLAEYKLFKTNYDYIKSVLSKTTLKKSSRKSQKSRASSATQRKNKKPSVKKTTAKKRQTSTKKKVVVKKDKK